MSFRSCIYTYHPRRKPLLRDLGEWKTELPLAHFLLVGANATLCRSAIWKDVRQKIAIRGDATQTRPLFLAFLSWLEPQLPRGFRKAADESRAMLLRADRQGAEFHWEPGEIYEAMDLEPAVMEKEAAMHADMAGALFEEVQRLIETDGTTLQDSTIPDIRSLAGDWKHRLGLGFAPVVYFALGGEIEPVGGHVEMPPLPGPSGAKRKGTGAGRPSSKRPSSKPVEKGRAASGKGSVNAARPYSPAERWAAAKQRANLQNYHDFGKKWWRIPDSDLVGWLYAAIGCGVNDEARRLVAAGADVNALREYGNGASCLENAAEKGNLRLVELLVEHGADVNHVGKNGDALVYALRAQHIEIYEYLKPLADPGRQKIAARYVAEAQLTKEVRDRAFAFHVACSEGDLAKVRQFLEEGTDVNARTLPMFGQTALAIAGQKKHTVIMELLLDTGADPNLESYTGVTPLMRIGNAEMCRMLLAAGANAKEVDDAGNGVLMWPSDAESCRLLLEAGARADLLNRSGAGSLRFVAWWTKHRHVRAEDHWKINTGWDRELAEIFRLLIAAGAKFEPARDDGSTALTLLDGINLPKAKKVLSTAPLLSPTTPRIRP